MEVDDGVTTESTVTSTLMRVGALVAVMSLTCLPILANGSELLDAIRRADTKQVRAMLQAGANPDLRDAGGVPALMRAVVYLPAEDVRLFIDRGADVNASSGSGATALMWAAPDTGKVRLLLDRGARPDLRAKDGATALVAAARFGNSDAMRLLLARGADPQASANGALDLLRIAYGRNDRTMRQLLADAGIRPADPKQLPGALASSIEQPEAVKTLLNAGADPNEPVRLGTIALASIAIAAHAGAVAGVSTLVDHGANPNAVGARGLRPLMVAAATNRSDAAPVRALLDRGADVHARDEAGRTALDWALMRGESEVASVLRLAGARGTVPVPRSTPAGEPRTAPAAIEAALAQLLPSGVTFQEEAGCISCHHQSLPAMAAALAARRGVAVNRTLARHPTEATLALWRPQEEQLLSGATRGVTFGFIASTTYGLLALAEEGIPSSSAIDAVVLRLASFQDADGGWYPGHADVRPPLDGSPITRAALAIRALSVYAPPGRRAEMNARIARARRFVLAATPVDTHDEAFKLLALVWSGARRPDVIRQRDRLLALQRQDGGWGQWPEMAPDAFATGQALYALYASGLKPRTAPYRKGADYLLRTQLTDGTWFVRSRAIGFQRYFDTGFPHGRNQFISAAATGWAAIALAYTLDQ